MRNFTSNLSCILAKHNGLYCKKRGEQKYLFYWLICSFDRMWEILSKINSTSNLKQINLLILCKTSINGSQNSAYYIYINKQLLRYEHKQFYCWSKQTYPTS